MIVAIGTKNPAKIRAVKSAFENVFDDLETKYITVSADSGVADQPMSDDESIKGAKNRAESALKETGADYAVGLEGNMQKSANIWFSGNIACVISKDTVAFGISPKVMVPADAASLVHDGQELSAALHTTTGVKNIGKKDGVLGYVTDGKITRSSGSEQAITLALCSLLKNLT